MVDISEKNFEETIENLLLAGGPDQIGEREVLRELATTAGEYTPGGYQRRSNEDYDRGLCLIPKDTLTFVKSTQPKEWGKLVKQYGSEAEERFPSRLTKEVERRGTLDVLRRGIKDVGAKINLAYFRPSSGMNPEHQRKYVGNLFSVVRQLHYSQSSEKSLDLVIFLNGLPIFTAELKNPLSGQTVEHAIRQYRTDRDPKEALFTFGRCLAHFAVDAQLVYFCTHLQGWKTFFFPLNRGRNGGAGNPVTLRGFPTAYLWERMWARDSILNLIQQFMHVVEEEDEQGRKTGVKYMIFPRYHQLEAVRRLINESFRHGTGKRYLVQHSAGSGKSFSIAWLAHQLSVLHDDQDKRVFNSIVVITDRRVLDRQLQRTMRQFEQTLGVVENIDQTSRQLKQALEDGKNIIVTTLQKFPVIADQMEALPGQRFAVIVDEAHSSQTGESVKSLKAVLAAGSLEEAEELEGGEPETMEDRINDEMTKRGQQPNVSTFAFTATPKAKTLELFGRQREDGTFAAFSLYTMRQAIEEGFIMDVLANYSTYRTYWSLLKKIEEDPRYDRKKANNLLRRFVDLHELTIEKKVDIIVTHFVEQVQARIKGKAKAMIVTRSRLHAVRFKNAVDKYLKDKGYPFKALVAFSGMVRDGGLDYSESNMNGFPESQTARQFERDEYRILIVAEKFQTGFDQPLLHSMYVDRTLSGLHAVQTLSRLNRIHPDKEETMVLDFANEADDIQKAFQPYYEKTILSESTDPNSLYTLESKLQEYDFFDTGDIEAFAIIYFDPKGTQDKLLAALSPVVERYEGADKQAREEFKGYLRDYVQLYAFLSQVISFTDVELEKLYAFSRLLLRRLPSERERLPMEITEKIDLESLKIMVTGQEKSISLPRGPGILDPIGAKGGMEPAVEEIEPLSVIIRELNERFGTDFNESDKVFVSQLEEQLIGDPVLENSARVNTPENFRLTFNNAVSEIVQNMMDTNFKFFRQINDDTKFARFFFDWLFERYLRGMEGEVG
jgi:type I restriction enzyme, R subunit